MARDTVAVETLARRAISRISMAFAGYSQILEHLSMLGIRLLNLFICGPFESSAHQHIIRPPNVVINQSVSMCLQAGVRREKIWENLEFFLIRPLIKICIASDSEEARDQERNTWHPSRRPD